MSESTSQADLDHEIADAMEARQAAADNRRTNLPPMRMITRNGVSQMEAVKKRTRPRLLASPSDPRCINLRSGLMYGAAFDRHFAATGETLPMLAARCGISAETLRGYQRGHATPSDQSRVTLETAMSLTPGSLKQPVDEPATVEGPQATTEWDGDYLVVTTRIHRSQVG